MQAAAHRVSFSDHATHQILFSMDPATDQVSVLWTLQPTKYFSVDPATHQILFTVDLSIQQFPCRLAMRDRRLYIILP